MLFWHKLSELGPAAEIAIEFRSGNELFIDWRILQKWRSHHTSSDLPLAFPNELWFAGLMENLHHLGDNADLRLGYFVRPKGEEIRPFGGRHDNRLPHEKAPVVGS